MQVSGPRGEPGDLPFAAVRQEHTGTYHSWIHGCAVTLSTGCPCSARGHSIGSLRSSGGELDGLVGTGS